MAKIIFFANTDWYLYNFRFDLIQRAQQSGHRVLCISPPGRFAHKLLDAEVPWQALPLVRSKSGLMSIIPTIRRLRKIFRETQPDLIHSFTLTSILLTWMAAPRHSSARLVNAVTGLGYVFTGNRLKHRLFRTLLHPFLTRALSNPNAWTVVQNPTDRDYLIGEFGLDPQKIALIAGSGVDVDRFRPSADKQTPVKEIRVAFVGRLLVDKGIVEFVAAAEALHDRFDQVKFFAAGERDSGNLGSVSATILQRWRESGVVDFVGQVENMPVFLAGMDIFTLPSYREGLSRSLIEAGAAGLPCVTTDMPGCRDVVTDGENGILLAARDPLALADAIERLDRDRQLTSCLGMAARKKALAEFDERIVIADTLAVYRELLGDA